MSGQGPRFYTTLYHRRYTTDKAILGHGGQGISKEMVVYGGDRGNRTPNLGIANAALSLVELYPHKAFRIDYSNQTD